MAEIKKLDIILSDEGWDDYGGQSLNVWGTVPFPKELLSHLNKVKNSTQYLYDSTTGKKITKTTKKASVWTAFDSYIYSRTDKIQPEELPRISATFKSCFSKYSAVCENIGMRIAMALDMPTSYNYIVKFNPSEHPKIINNYPNFEKKKLLQPYGIVSIDFLQLEKTIPAITSSEMLDEKGNPFEIPSINNLSGDQLISFEDALRKYGITANNSDGKENLVENWIKALDKIIEKEFADTPRETINKTLSKIHSRIARSFLTKDSLTGDCDFTAYNGGIVVNLATETIRYAPNHDFGECFNGLIKNIIAYDPYHGMTLEQVNNLPEPIKTKMIEAAKKSGNKSLREVARSWASLSSEENFYYIIKNFPNASEEFFESLDLLIQNGSIDKIIDKYPTMTCNGVPLLTQKEADLFKEYLYERASFISELYIDFLNKSHSKIHQIVYDNSHDL